MNTGNKFRRRVDPLLLLAVAVGLGVILTTTAQAETAGGLEQADQLQETRTGLALHPVKGLAERLDLHWLNRTLASPDVDQLLRKKRIGMGRPFGEKGPELNLSLRPKMRATAASSGDSGVGAASAERPDLYFSLRRAW